MIAPYIVALVIQAATCVHAPPDVMVGIVTVESRGQPLAQNSDGSLGLAQVHPKWHPEILQGPGWGNPYWNARVGSGVLVDCLELTAGHLESAIACYHRGPYGAAAWQAGEAWPELVEYVEEVLDASN